MASHCEGGCLCGAVRFRASGDPRWVGWCHCQSCRKHSGAPVSVFVAFAHADVKATRGAITKFPSSPGTRRGFCATCGSTLTCEGDARADELHVHVGAFDTPAALAPTFHIYPDERVAWLCLADPAEIA
jgi:hypothetical protein